MKNGAWNEHYFKTSSDQVVHTKTDGQASTVKEQLDGLNSALARQYITFTPYISGSKIIYQNCYLSPGSNRVHIELVIDKGTATAISADRGFMCNAPVTYRPNNAQALAFVYKDGNKDVIVSACYVSADITRNLTWLKHNWSDNMIQAYIVGDYDLYETISPATE